MHVYRYSFWKLLAMILFGIAMAWGASWLIENTTGKGLFAGYLFMACAPFVILIGGRFLLSDRVVLRIDAHGIAYKTLFGTQRVMWRDFHGAAVESVRTRGHTAHHLKLDFGKGFFGNCSISESLLEGDTEVGDILMTLDECMEGAAALDRGDYRHTSLGGAGAPARQAQPAGAAPPAVSGFGRKGL